MNTGNSNQSGSCLKEQAWKVFYIIVVVFIFAVDPGHGFQICAKKIERFLSDFTWRFFSLEALSHVKWIRFSEKDKNRSKSQLKAHELSAWVCSRKIADQRNKDTGLFRFMLLFVVTQNNNTQIEVLITEVLITWLKGAYWARAFHKLLEIS